MKYILRLINPFDADEPLEYVLNEKEARENVKYWLNRIFQNTLKIPRKEQLKVEALRNIFLSIRGNIFTEINSKLTPIDLNEPLESYSKKSTTEYATEAVAELIFSYGLGLPQIELGGQEIFLNLLGSEKTRIKSDIPPNFEDRLALVLGGGGAKGAAQAGAIKALLEVFSGLNRSYNMGAQIHYVVGSSIGAFNGFFVAGNKIRELERFWKSVTPITALRLVNAAKNNVKQEEITIPVEVSKVNLQTGIVEFSDVENSDIYEELKKSMRYPGFLPAVKSGKYQYSDGGIASNLPISRCVEKHCYWIIIIGLDSFRTTTKRFLWPFGQSLRAIEIQGNEIQKYQKVLLQIGSYISDFQEKLDDSNLSIDDGDGPNKLDSLRGRISSEPPALDNQASGSLLEWMRKGEVDLIRG